MQIHTCVKEKGGYTDILSISYVISIQQ